MFYDDGLKLLPNILQFTSRFSMMNDEDARQFILEMEKEKDREQEGLYHDAQEGSCYTERQNDEGYRDVNRDEDTEVRRMQEELMRLSVSRSKPRAKKIKERSDYDQVVDKHVIHEETE